MPQALKAQELYGDDVQYVFVSNGESPQEIETFAAQKGWFNDRAIWTTEAPFQTGASTIPHCVVLGIDGEVLINGNPLSLHSKIEEALAEQIKLAKKGPKGLAAPLAKPWQDFEKGSYAAAIEALRAVPEGADKKAADELAASFETRAKAKVSRLSWLIESAEFDKADKLAPALVKGLAGHALEEKAKELAAQLSAKEMAPEREAAKQLDKIEKRIAKDGLDSAVLKQLTALGEKHAETRAGKRARHLASLVGG